MKDYEKHTLPIKTWAEDDRPREKLYNKGKQNLSDAELLAIILGSGTREESALGLAQRILLGADNNLIELGKMSLAHFMRYKGVGKAKAIALTAALELGRRRQLAQVQSRPVVRSSRDAYNLVAPLLQDLPHEEFWILLLNRANKVICREQVSRGGTAGTVVDAKIIFRKALDAHASSLILCHNHPSGNLQPSQADIDITRKLVEGARLIDLSILDHLIIAGNGFFSFADEGRM